MRQRQRVLWRLREAYLRWRWEHMLTLAEHYKVQAVEAKTEYDAHKGTAR